MSYTVTIARRNATIYLFAMHLFVLLQAAVRWVQAMRDAVDADCIESLRESRREDQAQGRTKVRDRASSEVEESKSPGPGLEVSRQAQQNACFSF